MSVVLFWKPSNGSDDLLVVERPGHAVETADVLVRKLAEGSGREVEIELGAALAAVGDRDGDLLAVVCGGKQISVRWRRRYRLTYSSR